MTERAGPHAHHITPLKVYIGVAIALVILTVVTVFVARQDFGSWNMLVALGVAVFKASLVGLFFMHLLYDNKMYSLVFVSSLVFLAVFIGFTMFDTVNRDGVDIAKAELISPSAEIYDTNGRVIDNTPVDPSALTEFQLLNGIGPVKASIALAALNPLLAQAGKKIFDVKCASCHRLNERLVGPALGGVTKRRSPEFIMNMIMNPEAMTKYHPEVRKMLAEYLTFMISQNVSKQEARAILEYLRSEDESSD